MKYENIDVNSLKNAINVCRNAINYSGSISLTSEIMNGTIWLCSARENLKSALSKLVNEYKELEKNLSQYAHVANLIGEYQEKIRQNAAYQNEYHQLNDRLYRDENYQESCYNPEIEEWELVTKSRRVKDGYVERQMNEIYQKMEYNKQKIYSLENEIYNVMG